MNPLLALAAVGAVALLGSKSKQSGTATVEAGTYRVSMRIAPVEASVPLSNLFAMPHLTMVGVGGVTVFESLTVDPKDMSAWTLTGLMQYGGTAKQVNLLPGMTLERL